MSIDMSKIEKTVMDAMLKHEARADDTHSNAKVCNTPRWKRPSPSSYCHIENFCRHQLRKSSLSTN
jgi:hypothetical protein